MYYHRSHPEFTIKITDLSDAEAEERTDEPNHNYFYLYAAIGVLLHPKIQSKRFTISLHITILYSVEIISCDEGNYQLCPFENEYLETLSYDYGCEYKFQLPGEGKHSLISAYLISDSDKALVNSFIYGLDSFNHNKGACDKTDIESMVLFFNDDGEKREFFDMVNNRKDEFIKRFEKTGYSKCAPENSKYKYDINMSLRGANVLTVWLKEWRGLKNS